MTVSSDDGLPKWVGAGLDMDVARWLLVRADRLHGGDMEAAINATVRTVMIQQDDGRRRGPLFPSHAGLGLPCAPCGGDCTVDSPQHTKGHEPGS